MRLRDIGKSINADRYISGIGGVNYQKVETYTNANIDLIYFTPPKQIEFIDDISVTIFEHISKLGYRKISEIIYDFKNSWLSSLNNI